MAVTTIKRTALYAHIWERPMIHVGADFGITGNGLKKICIKHDIPRPPAGYFMMKSEKQARLKRVLPPRENDPDITISSSEDPVDEASSGECIEVLIPETPDPEISKEIDAYVKLLRSDPWTDERGIIRPRDQPPECLIRCSPEMVDATAKRFKLILTALKANGCRIEFKSRTHHRYSTATVEVNVIYGRVKQALRVEETATRKQRPLSAKEAKEKERDEARGWSFYRSNPWIFTPTGKPQLVFGYYKRRILAEDLTSLVRTVLKELKERDESEIRWEIERRHERAEQLWSLRGLRREIWEERQFAAIEKEAKKWDRAERLRRYIARVEEMGDDYDVEQWLEMAKQLVDDLDPISSKTFAMLVDLPKYKEVEKIANRQKYHCY